MIVSDLELEKRCILDLAVGSVFQNEAPYLKEWIEFHKLIGVQHFVLVNDRSSDNFEEVLQPYVDSGEVELFTNPCPPELDGKKWMNYQLMVFSSLLKQMRGVSRWLALIDIDEFILPAEGYDLIRFLGDFEDCGGLYIRWEPFGTSYIERLGTSDLLTDKLTLKWNFNEGVDMLGKSIVKPHRVLCPNIHRCILLPGFQYADSNPGMRSRQARIRINHYWSRDEYFLFNVKVPRCSRIHGWEVTEDRREYFRHLYNDITDKGMQELARDLHKRIFGT